MHFYQPLTYRNYSGPKCLLELLCLRLSKNTVLGLDTVPGLDWAEPRAVALRWDHRPVLPAPEVSPWLVSAWHPRMDCTEPGFSLDFRIFAEVRDLSRDRLILNDDLLHGDARIP